MLIMVDSFTWGDFLFTTISCAIGVLVLGIGMTGYAFTHMGIASQAVLVISALLMISPNITMTFIGVVIALPTLALNWGASRRALPS